MMYKMKNKLQIQFILEGFNLYTLTTLCLSLYVIVDASTIFIASPGKNGITQYPKILLTNYP